MELPGIFRGLAETISKIAGNKRVSVEPAPDPQYIAALESRGKAMLVRLFTDPRSLESLGRFGHSNAGFQEAGEQLTRMEADLGINSNIVPHLTANLRVEATRAAGITVQNREQALSLVASDRRSTIEEEALLEAQRILREKLKEKEFSRDYRAGASEMLKRIEDRLKEKIALPGENPTLLPQ